MRRLSNISRRRFLRGVAGGALTTVALPFFEASLGTTARAFAADGFPKRFGLFYWANGVLPQYWTPAETGANYTLSEQLQPLAAVQDLVTVVTGVDVKLPNLEPHTSGIGGILTGRPLLYKPSGDHTFSGPTIDQVIAAEIGGETRFRSLEFGAQAAGGQSYNGPDSRNPAESSPWALFQRIFGADFREPGDDSGPDPRLALRRSVLDAVVEDMRSFERDLGRADRARLDQHLTSVRELETRLARLAEDPVTLAACTRPAEPLEDYPDIDGRPQLTEANRAMCDTIALALACDQTRVFSNFITKPLNNLLIGQATAGHHQLTHDEPGDQPQVNAIVKQLIGEYAYLVEALAAIPEGDGTLLENCVVMGTSDVAYGRTHELTDFPILYAGSANGRLRTGEHVRDVGQNASQVLLSFMRALDITAGSFGDQEGYTESGLSSIER